MCAPLVYLLSSLLFFIHLLSPSFTLSLGILPPSASGALCSPVVSPFFFYRPSLTELLDATFPSFFSLMINLSLVHLLTTFVAFACSSAIGLPFSSHQGTSFLRLLLSSLIPQLPLSLFLALPSVALHCCTIASRPPWPSLPCVSGFILSIKGQQQGFPSASHLADLALCITSPYAPCLY